MQSLPLLCIAGAGIVLGMFMRVPILILASAASIAVSLLGISNKRDEPLVAIGVAVSHMVVLQFGYLAGAWLRTRGGKRSK